MLYRRSLEPNLQGLPVLGMLGKGGIFCKGLIFMKRMHPNITHIIKKHDI